MKVAVIGFGKMGMLHGGLMAAMPRVELSAASDKSKMLLRAFKAVMPGIRFYDDHGKMVDETKPDAVIVTTPTFSHFQIAMDMARRKIPFFIEKPLTTTYETSLKLQDEMARNDVKGMVGFCCRNIGTFGRAREMIEAGRIGKVLSVYACNYLSDVMRKEKGWRFDKALSGGGVVIDYSIHMLDLLKWTFGEIKSLNAATKSIYSETVEDELDSVITFKTGISARFQSSWSNPDYRKTYMKMEISGELGTITATDQTLELAMKDGTSERLSSPDLYRGYAIDIAGPMYSVQMTQFYDLIAHGKPVESDIANGVAVQKLVDLIYKSSANGRAEIEFDTGDVI